MSEALSSQVDLSLYAGVDYFVELQKRIMATEASGRIAVMTMCLEPSELVVDDTLAVLNQAADRGVNTHLGVDAYAMMINFNPLSIGPLMSPVTFNKGLFERRQQSLDELNGKDAAQVAIINAPTRPFTNPYGKRSHLKGAVVDDHVYIGGPNLDLTGRVDATVGFQDRDAADWLYSLTSAIIKSRSASKTLATIPTSDLHYKLDDTTEILIDNGEPHDSPILDAAIEHIDAAKDWIMFSSQIVPNGRVAAHLAAAHKQGVDVRLAYNNPTKWGKIAGTMQRYVLAKQRRRAPEIFDNGKLPANAPDLHAKILATEQGAMVGTHNLSDAGVAFGTPEIALFRESEEFAKAVRLLLLSQLDLPVSQDEISRTVV
jgi:phosphatidylserine/phosphatidylglycerophosphate/cardiolipin synthase-like enzyme